MVRSHTGFLKAALGEAVARTRRPAAWVVSVKEADHDPLAGRRPGSREEQVDVAVQMEEAIRVAEALKLLRCA